MRMGMGKEAKANKIVMLNFDVDVREMCKNIKQRQKKIHEWRSKADTRVSILLSEFANRDGESE